MTATDNSGPVGGGGPVPLRGERGGESIDAILVSHYREVYTYIWRLLGRRACKEDVEDLMQDVCLKAHNALLKKNSLPEESLVPWLKKIAKRTVIDYWRKQGRRADIAREVRLDETQYSSDGDEIGTRESTTPDPESDHEDETVDRLAREELVADVRETLDHALSALKPAERACLDGWIQDRSDAEIGAELDMPKGTVGSHHSRARKKLREMLADFEAKIREVM